MATTEAEIKDVDHVVSLLRDYAEANEWEFDELPGDDDVRYLGIKTERGTPISVVVNVTP